MSNKDKIEDLFRSKLKNGADNGDWSNPPDLPWNNAQKIVNDEIAAKKKRRRFFFLIPLGLLGTVALVYLFSPTGDGFSRVFGSTDEVTVSIELDEKGLDELGLSGKELGQEKVKRIEKNGEGLLEEKTEAIDDTAAQGEMEAAGEKRAENSDISNRQTGGSSRIGSASTKGVDDSPIARSKGRTSENYADHQQSKVTDGVTKSGGNSIDELRESTIAELLPGRAGENDQAADTTLNSKQLGLATAIAEEDVIEEKLEIEDFDLLAVKEISFQELEHTTKERSLPALAPLTEKLGQRPLHVFEVGLGHAFYPRNPFRSLDQEDFGNEVDELATNASYFNLSTYFSARINRRWSLSTGLYYSNQNLDISYLTTSFYAEDNFENNLDPYLNIQNPSSALGLNRRASSSVQNVSIIGENTSINFFPGANLMEGDDLKINGRVPMNIEIITIPLSIQRHWYFRNFEYTAFTGFSLNYMSFSVKELPISVFNESKLVAEEVLFEPFDVKVILPNFILGVGMKYHFDEQWNTSLSYNLNPIAQEFSKFHLGLNYSF